MLYVYNIRPYLFNINCKKFLEPNFKLCIYMNNLFVKKRLPNVF